MSKTIKIRFAEKSDAELVLSFIKEHAQYEEPNALITATKDDIANSLLLKHAEVIIAEINSQPVGFALFFRNYSSFLGKQTLYIEDLYVKDAFRGSGVGSALLRNLASFAHAQKYERIDLFCLDTNTSAQKFYKKHGGKIFDDRRLLRFNGDNLKKLIEPDE